MSSHPYVTQQNTPLADDTTLMSTTDLQSYITHANDTFVQVSGYTLQELQGQPHNMVRHPDMPKAAFADMWFTLKKGEPWSGIVKNRRKNGDHYWVRANAVPMVREGKISGYMSIRTRATDEEIAAVEPLYKALNAGRTGKRIHKGLVVRKGWLGKLPSLPASLAGAWSDDPDVYRAGGHALVCRCPGGDVFPLCVSDVVGKCLF